MVRNWRYGMMKWTRASNYDRQVFLFWQCAGF